MINYMAEKLTMACQGKDANSGGLSKKELRNLVTELNPTLGKGVLHLSRPKLLALVCNRLCPTIRYSGAVEIIKDIDVKYVGGRIQFTYKRAPIEPKVEKLAEGSYGIVYKHTFRDAKGNTLHFATKETRNGDMLEEAIVVQDYTSALRCPGIISMKIRNMSDGQPVAIMPLADGDLDRFRGLIMPMQAEHIVSVIGKALICMHRQDIHYFDVKPLNILYNCDGRGILYIYLGDMGSIIMSKYDGMYSATYPPPQAKSGRVPASLKKDALSIYTYQLSCLYCQLISRAEPPVWNRSTYYQYFSDLNKMITTTAKIGGEGNRFISVLIDFYKSRNPSTIPDLDKFL